MSGAGSGGRNDGGVSDRVLGSLLTWMSDREPGNVFIVATANDVRNLPPALTRAGRFNASFFVDLPSEEEKADIWRIHLSGFGFLDPAEQGDAWKDVKKIDTTGWTGAEIHSCCEMAWQLEMSLKDASGYVVPVAKRDPEGIKDLRDWASGRCLSADTGKPFSAAAEAKVETANGSGRRKVTIQKPAQN